MFIRINNTVNYEVVGTRVIIPMNPYRGIRSDHNIQVISRRIARVDYVNNVIDLRR